MDDKQTQARITRTSRTPRPATGHRTAHFRGRRQIVFTGEYPWDQLKAMLDARLAKQP